MERERRRIEAIRTDVARRGDQIRKNCERLHGFVREAWHVLEPNTEFVDNWHIGAVCEHLEAITLGQINRLLINMPPGCMKSLTASVLWEAWEWGPAGKPGLRYLTTSYLQDYAGRDARKHRDLVLSEWYQALWPLKLLRAGEMSFENEHRGGREAMPFASLTAGRGNRVVIDDPHSTEKAESETERARATRIFRESVTSRLNDPILDAILAMMHRLHGKDICGVIEELGLPYVKLILPMEFEPARRCVTSIGFKDPRTHDGELLFPERFPREVIDRDKRALGSYAWAGQYQQRPTPREGGLFKRSWFPIVAAAPADCKRVRHWDLAATRKQMGVNPAFTAGLKLAVDKEGRYYVEDVTRDQAEGPAVRRMINNTASLDTEAVEISLPKDPGQAGKVQAQDMVAMLAGFRVHAEAETGDKVTRAEPVAAQAEAGNVMLVRAPWNEAFLDEVSMFPGGPHSDQVDALSGAFGRLTTRKKQREIRIW